MDTEGSVTHPSLDWGSRRVPLEPGQARRVSFRPHAEFVRVRGHRPPDRAQPGRQLVMFGSSSADVACETQVRITGTRCVLDDRRASLAEVSVEPAEAW